MNKKTEILLYTRPLTPPWDEASKNLAFDLSKNIKVDNLNFRILTDKSFSKEKFLKNYSIIPEPIYQSSKFNQWAKIKLLFRLLRPNLKANIVHFLFTPRSLTSFIIRTRLFFSGAKTVQTIATLDKKLYQDQPRLKKVLFADKIVAQSKFTQKNLKGAGFDNVEVIYPGIDLEKFTPRKKDVQLMQRWGIKNQDLVILFAGEYTRLKAIDDIMDAIEIIFEDKDSKARFILACRIKSKADEVKKAEIIEKINQKWYKDKVIFVDTFSDMPKLFSLSDINLFPVREMSGKFDIPLAVVEAMAYKKPVIISDIPVLEEFVKDGETGLVVPKANPKELAEAIKKLFDQELRTKLGANAHDYTGKHFDIKNNAKKYQDLYQQLT